MSRRKIHPAFLLPHCVLYEWIGGQPNGLATLEGTNDFAETFLWNALLELPRRWPRVTSTLGVMSFRVKHQAEAACPACQQRNVAGVRMPFGLRTHRCDLRASKLAMNAQLVLTSSSRAI